VRAAPSPRGLPPSSFGREFTGATTRPL